MPKVTFNNKNNVFYQTLKTEVESYFAKNNLKKTGNWRLYTKSIILLPLTVIIYVALLFLPMPVIAGVLLSCTLGLLLACIGFNVMHDACHGSYSTKDWVNNAMGFTLNALGGNAFIWKFKHNIIHHTYTNIDGMDDDIAKSPLMRHCATQKWVPAHRFQHIYSVPSYALSSLAWVLYLDFNKYFKQRIVYTPLQKMRYSEHIVFWISKVLYVAVFIVIPILMLGWKPWLIGFGCMHLVLGFVLAVVFQLAHVVEDTSFAFVEKNDTFKIEDEWALHQVKTTANFAPENKVVSWFVGGLNYQIEHHLFPRVSHVHYPALRKIVKKVCQQYEVGYNEFPTMRKAVVSHFKMLRILGKKSAVELA